MTNHTFIYALKEKGTETIRYVGKSNDPYKRLYQHIKNYEKLKGRKSKWINSVIKNGKEIEIIILDKVDISDWQEREIYWIKYYESDKLTNAANGGIGGAAIIYKEDFSVIKKWVQNNLPNISSVKKWYKYIKENNLPNFIPSNPKDVYEKRGWISWGDFLGTNRIQDNKKINYISYEESKKWIKDNIVCDSITEWKSIKKPDFIPNRPNRYYEKRGWISWGDFLGNNKIANQKRNFLNYDECRKWIFNNLPEINTVTKWRNYSKLSGFPDFIPSNPDKTYKDEWSGWTNFLNN